MKIYIIIISALFIPVQSAAADWDNLNVKIIGSGPSEKSGYTKIRLRDSDNRTFEVNYTSVPDKTAQKRIIVLKDIFSRWERIKSGSIEFYFSPDGIYVNLRTKEISYKDENLHPYLPAGLAFQETNDVLNYRFRIIVENKSHMLDGIYIDEEDLLKKIYNFIKKQEQAGTSVEVEVKGKPSEDNIKYPISVSVSGSYLVPTGKLGRVYSEGYGATAGMTLHNLGVSMNDKTLFHMDFTISAGYWNYCASNEIYSESSCKIGSAYVIPLTLSSAFHIKLPGRFSVSPMAGVGYNYNSVDYYEPVYGSYYQPVEIRAWAPSLFAGLQFGYTIIEDKINILADAQYIWMFERYMTATSIVFHAGLEYTFAIAGD